MTEVGSVRRAVIPPGTAKLMLPRRRIVVYSPPISKLLY